jgi:hypothetical protein
MDVQGITTLRDAQADAAIGMYREVAVRVDDSGSAQAWDYAYGIEGDVEGKLARWDEQARVDLGLSQI